MALISATVALTVLGSLNAPRSAPVDLMARFPRVTLWAWERREDLSFIDPHKVGVAYLAGTLYLIGDRVVMRPRSLPLTVPRDSSVIAVVRIETERMPAATMSPRQSADAARAIASMAKNSPQSRYGDSKRAQQQKFWYRGSGSPAQRER